jgi:Mrp family chromosome partitioning ATPase
MIETEAPTLAPAVVEERVAEPAAVRAPVPEPVVSFVEPDVREATPAPSADVSPPVNEIERLAADICAPGPGARKITILGTAPGESIARTALVLARLMAQELKVVVVDLAASSPVIADASTDPNAPGLVELMQGEASFTQIISKDRLSRVQLVSAGRPGFDRAVLQSPRLLLAIDALMRVYDRVVLESGTAADLPAELLTALGRAVVVPDAAMDGEARKQMSADLKAVGFSDVTMLSKACEPSDEIAAAPRVVAA